MSTDAETLRALRAASPESQAGKLARVIYPGVFKPFARSFYNSGSVMEQRLQRSIVNGKPIPMVGFWGVGGKHQPDKYDERLLDRYEAIREAVSTHYPQGLDVMLILAHTHGRFNGYQEFDDYLGAIASDALSRGIVSVPLDELYRDWDIALPDRTMPIDKSSPEWGEFASSRRFAQFVESASKHSQAGLDTESAAFHYWMMRRQEREHLSRSFPDAILFINGSEDMGRETLPLDMPHIYSRIGPVWFYHD